MKTLLSVNITESQKSEFPEFGPIGWVISVCPRFHGIRIDKWLWAARFFKTRAMAARACELGRIQSNHQPAKPSREVRPGDLLQIKKDTDDFQVEVLLLSAVRGPASIAQTLYRETEASRELRLKAAEERKANKHFAPAPAGRPSKRDRRRIIQFRTRAERNSEIDTEG
jgi:ribosome-associated heat shock protein Hsp15